MDCEAWLFPPEGVSLIHQGGWSCEEERAAHERWMALPLEERRAAHAARIGLFFGDLGPLAALIRAGHGIERGLALAIADAIEGPNEDGFCLSMKLAKGRKSPELVMRKHFRDLEMYWRVMRLRGEARLAGEAGVSDAIFAQVADEYGVSVSTVKKAWRDRQ